MTARRTRSSSPKPDAASNLITAVERWETTFRCPAPTRLPSFIAQALAWQEQATLHGDVSLAVRQDLKAAAYEARALRVKQRSGDHPLIACEPDASRENFTAAQRPLRAPRAKPAALPPPVSSQLTIGTRLVKSHGGETHVVEVTAAGMLHKGQLYGSLSAVAKAITGTHWNGMLFFGLRHRKQYGRKLGHG